MTAINKFHGCKKLFSALTKMSPCVYTGAFIKKISDDITKVAALKVTREVTGMAYE